MSQAFDIAARRAQQLEADGRAPAAERSLRISAMTSRGIAYRAARGTPSEADALRAEREAACSHPAEMRQPRLPSGTRCGACDEASS